jgi:glutamate synthase (NADPH/NADH) small chain
MRQMGDQRGFLKYPRKTFSYRPVCDRVKDFEPVILIQPIEHTMEQASRCMDCGTPFCNWACPLGNYIPEWNDNMFRGRFSAAFDLLDAMNTFPEITGRVCPAPCEYACVLGINDFPVTIRENELAIVEKAFELGLVRPNPPKIRTGKKVAVIGSGPAGLSAASALNKLGYTVTVFEKDDKLGGILRYGIPDFKLEKSVIDRRVKIWEAEGIGFRTSTNITAEELEKDFDAVCLAAGCRAPRDLKIEGRNLHGIHFAMDYLIQSNKRVAGEKFSGDELMDAKDKSVLVIGGGDTGADCVGTAHRQGAKCVTQVEILPEPPKQRPKGQEWPKYPLILKVSSSHEEGGERKWAISTKKFTGQSGKVKKAVCTRIEFVKEPGQTRPVMKEIKGSEFDIEADLVILAMGFTNPEKQGLLSDLKVKFDDRGNVKRDENFMTSVKGVFAAGDISRGPSLIVWALAEGIKAAGEIDKYLANHKK